MDKLTRNLIQKVTQDARRLLETEFGQQLEGLFDILPDGTIAPEPGKHLDATQRIIRQKIVAAIEHEKASGSSDSEAVTAYLRETSFTYLNRFVALKMLEARGLTQECVSRGEQSSGFKEFIGLAPGLAELPDRGYGIYIESLMDELSVEIRVLFDRQNPASLLWPRRKALVELLSILNRDEIAGIWSEDETIGWVYQYFNSGEERKEMRDESATPRNSRELAVRNQFFTPRYVVKFLTDNTLGRIWYEMRKGGTALQDACRYLVRRPNEVFLTQEEKAPVEDENETDLTQEELLKKSVYIEHRPKKDPRDLRVLDPACGSGHFLLYAFDLLERIYNEAWEDSESPQSEATSRTLREDFKNLEELRRVVPKLIIEHNLHGIDIDARAVQIATLSLWLRAQKTWKNLDIKAADRSPLAKSNIVTAEPMPGEEEIRREFTAGLKPRVLGQLVDVVFDKMKLAGEAGSLLKIEEEIKDAVAEARKQWLEGPKPEQQLLFPDMAYPRPMQQELRFDLKGVTDERFWEQAEDCILEALKVYAERAENSHAIRRRLFAEDAARGFSFIDLCRKRYDVVLMNPPFGLSARNAKRYIENTFNQKRLDFAACFISRFSQRAATVAAITTRNIFYLSSYTSWRQQQLFNGVLSIDSFVDLGGGVLDGAMVETALFVLRDRQSRYSTFYDCSRARDKRSHLIGSLDANRKDQKDTSTFIKNPMIFNKLPTNSISYWAQDSIIELFEKQKSFEAIGNEAWVGLQTNDDFQWVRLFWEVPIETLHIGRSKNLNPAWVPYAKGGEYREYFPDLHLVIQWGNDGVLIKLWKAEQFRLGLITENNSKCWNESKYFRKGLTWSQRSQRGLSTRALPEGCVFGIKGPGAFVTSLTEEVALCIFNSEIFRFLVSLQMAFGSYDTGVIRRTPLPESGPFLSGISDKAIELLRLSSVRSREDECHRLFSIGKVNETEGVRSFYENQTQAYRKTLESISEIKTKIEKQIRKAYGIAGVVISSGDRIIQLDDESHKESEPDEVGSPQNNNDCGSSIVSRALGFVLGRWDIRFATGEKPDAEWPDPFAPLPICQPGMLQGPDGLPVKPENVPPDYPIRISRDGILVDDPGFEGRQLHDQDIVLRMRDVFDVLWKQKAQDIEREACEILNVSDLRNYFRKSFFKDHIKRYSKSRRKAPIYWQLSTPSASYSIWLYYHRFTKDTFYKVLNEYVMPKLQFEERELTNIRQQYRISPTGGQRKKIAAREAFVAELTTFKEEVVRITPLWNPNLNDGVIINFAPLWRLVPQNKPWQKECKKVWDKLVKGDYDWAHLAMHLWPDRVIKKCSKDRSLANAHGLEEAFWEENDNGKWKPRKVSQETIDSLIQELTIPTVKAAIEDLLKASIHANMAGKKRKKKV